MKLSRYSLALCLAATIGLSVPARQGQCHGGLDNLARPTEHSGSPSYQAAQNYEDYDCFATGCHYGYGDILPDLNSDESNVREEGLPPEPVNTDANRPGDEPASREIPTVTPTVPQAPAPDEGFVREDEVPQTVPARGYFSPGYPHPGYMHPNYGYSHTEISGSWYNSSASSDDSEELTEQQVAAEAAAEEALVEDAVTQSADPQTSTPDNSAIEEALAEEGFGEDSLADEGWAEEALEEESLAEETLEEEPVAKTAPDDLSQEYARYDDTYGYDSEWYGPYDATKVVPQPTAEELAAAHPETATSRPADYSLTSQYEDHIQEVDPAPAIESDSESIVDYGPAELEVDATTAAAPAGDDEDAAFAAAIADSHDEWFYRETYGYGPRYDYDQYGYEDFEVTSPAAERSSADALPEVARDTSEASETFPWDYVYRLELGELNTDTTTSAAVRVPYALHEAKLNDVIADDVAEETDPAVPAGSDFDPSALISSAGEKIGRFDGREILANIAWLSRTLTPMELTRRALAAAPVAKRGRLIVLIPQPKVIEIQPFQPDVNSDEALRELALMLDDAGRALQMLSRRVEAYADSTSPARAADVVTPLQSRNPADSETR